TAQGVVCPLAGARLNIHPIDLHGWRPEETQALRVALHMHFDFLNLSPKPKSRDHLMNECHGWLVIRAALKIEHVNFHTGPSWTFDHQSTPCTYMQGQGDACTRF